MNLGLNTSKRLIKGLTLVAKSSAGPVGGLNRNMSNLSGSYYVTDLTVALMRDDITQGS